MIQVCRYTRLLRCRVTSSITLHHPSGGCTVEWLQEDSSLMNSFSLHLKGKFPQVLKKWFPASSASAGPQQLHFHSPSSETCMVWISTLRIGEVPPKGGNSCSLYLLFLDSLEFSLPSLHYSNILLYFIIFILNFFCSNYCVGSSLLIGTRLIHYLCHILGFHLCLSLIQDFLFHLLVCFSIHATVPHCHNYRGLT